MGREAINTVVTNEKDYGVIFRLKNEVALEPAIAP